MILTSAAIAVTAGAAIGFGIYTAIYDPSDTAFLAGLVEALFGAAVGLLVFVITYTIAAMKMMKAALPKERIIGRFLRLRVLLVPVVFVMFNVGLFQFDMMGLDLGFQLLALCASLTLVYPWTNAGKAVIVFGSSVVLSYGLGTALDAQAQRKSAKDSAAEDAADFAQWNGPLVLVNGNTTDLPDPTWKIMPVESPYGNEESTSVKLHWRQYGTAETEANFVVSAFNSPIEKACPYENTCELIGQSSSAPSTYPAARVRKLWLFPTVICGSPRTTTTVISMRSSTRSIL